MPKVTLRRVVRKLQSMLIRHMQKPAASTALRVEEEFSGNYQSWAEAARVATGIDSQAILEKTRLAMAKVRDGIVPYARDGVAYEQTQYSWPLLACVLWIASRSGNGLNLVDFGGALGTTYYQNRRFLSHLGMLRWNVVEQAHVVVCGRQEFTNEHLMFHEGLADCVRDCRPNAILLSSVVQYLENPYALLEQIGRLGFRFVLLDRTALIAADCDRLTVQRVPSWIFDASYPCWFLSETKLLRSLQGAYSLVAEFKGFETANIPHSSFKGFLFEQREVLPSGAPR